MNFEKYIFFNKKITVEVTMPESYTSVSRCRPTAHARCKMLDAARNTSLSKCQWVLEGSDLRCSRVPQWWIICGVINLDLANLNHNDCFAPTRQEVKAKEANCLSGQLKGREKKGVWKFTRWATSWSLSYGLMGPISMALKKMVLVVLFHP